MKASHKVPLSRRTTSRLLNFLSSTQLTLVLLLIIACVCVLGTLIPQQEASLPLAAHLSPRLRSLFDTLGLFDVYQSDGLRIAGVLLCVNLIVCSWRRILPILRRPGSGRVPAMPARGAQELRIASDIDAQSLADELSRVLRGRYRLRVQTQTDTLQVFGERGRFAPLWTLLLHLSVLVILVGISLGSFGFAGHMDIPVGTTLDHVCLARQAGLMDLGFDVRCDDFQVDFYEGGRPKEFRSELAFIKDGVVVHQGPVLVNHPQVFEGIRFYQASYRPLMLARLRIRTPGGETAEHIAGEHDLIRPASGEALIEVLRIEENLMKMGPAVELKVSTNGGNTLMWVFQHIEDIARAVPDIFERAPKFDPGRVPAFRFSLEGLEMRYATGLMVSRDPGVITVAIGGVLLLAGVLLSFLAPRRRLWIDLTRETEGPLLRINATSGRRICLPEKAVLDLISTFMGGHS